MSEIINRICVGLGKFDKREDGDKGPAQIQLEIGNCMEGAIARGLAERFALDNPDRYVHGLEVEKDGITGNIDLFDTVDNAVEECKITKYSLNRLNREGIEGETFWHYWRQVMSYCHMVGSDTGRLHIVFINGNYKYDPADTESGWQYRVWEDKWTNRELTDNWGMLLGHRKG